MGNNRDSKRQAFVESQRQQETKSDKGGMWGWGGNRQPTAYYVTYKFGVRRGQQTTADRGRFESTF